MGEIFIGKYGKDKKEKRYVYYDKATKKRHTASLSQFKNIGEFKSYIQGKGYIFGTKIYKEAESPVRQGVNYDFIESKRLTKTAERYVINGKSSFKGAELYGRSAPNKRTDAETVNDAKSQVKNVLAQQIMKYQNPARYNEEMHDDEYHDDIDKLAESLNDDNIDYSYTYSHEK